MTLPIDRGDREFQKFRDRPSGTAVAVVLEDSALSSALPVYLGIPAGAFHFRAEVTSTPGSFLTAITLGAVPAGKIRRVLSVRVVSRFEASWKALDGATIVANGKTSPASPSDDYRPLPCINVAAGAVMKVDVLQPSGPAALVQVMVSGFDESI